MNKYTPLNYIEDFYRLQPSLFRESDNIHKLIECILYVCDEQQKDFLWLAENILDLDKAVGSHLDFIGGLVGQTRFLSDFNTEPYFGFKDSYQSQTFGSASDPSVGGYWNSRSYFNTASSRKLNDDEYRRMIKARVLSNKSSCTTNELLEVVNTITNSTRNTVQMTKHGLIQIKTSDTTGILSYFVDRLGNEDNILPIAAGVRVGLESLNSEANIEVSDFDYAVIRYRWSPSGGTDLDTRTYLSSPDRSGNIVGWNRQASDEGYLVWNGDNTNDGVETVLLDVKKILQDYPSQQNITVIMKAFWYNTLGSGDVDVKFATYKGGVMQKSGFDFVNIGGAVKQNLIINTNSTDSDREGDGQTIGMLKFSTTTKNGTLLKV